MRVGPRCLTSRSGLSEGWNSEGIMAALVSPAGLPRPLVALAAFAAALLLGTFALWAYYGTAVFFEVVRAGWTACF